MRRFAITRGIAAEEFEKLDLSSSLVFFAEEAVAKADEELVLAVASRRAMVIATAAGEPGRCATALLLHADVAFARADTRLVLAGGDAVAGVVRRLGRAATAVLVAHEAISAPEALRIGLLDGLVPAGQDSLQWVEGWLGSRSIDAMRSAAGLLRRRGGDVLERAEFARLFATGEPQRGMSQFLERRPAHFTRSGWEIL